MMKKLTYLSLLGTTIIGMAVGDIASAQGKSGLLPGNPFSETSKLHMRAPDFTKIKNSDYQPAIEEGIKQQMAETERIANNPAAPTFANTLIPLEKSGQLLRRVNSVFNLLTGAYTNPELQKVETEIAPKLSANSDAIYLNTKLFKRIATIYNKRSTLKLDAESKRLVEYYYENFIQAGAQLSESDKTTSPE